MSELSLGLNRYLNESLSFLAKVVATSTVLAGGLVSSLSVNANVLIDNFNVAATGVFVGATGTSDDNGASTEAGTERDVNYYLVGGSCYGGSPGILGGRASLSNFSLPCFPFASAGDAHLKLVYDGEDGNATVLAHGLSLDLTESSKNNAITFSHLPVNNPNTQVTAKVHSGAGNYSEYTLSLPKSSMTIALPFAAFTTGGGTGADFSAVTAIEFNMLLDGLQTFEIDTLQAAPSINSSLSSNQILDINHDGDYDPGDVVEYTVVLQNLERDSSYADGVVYTASLNTGSTLVVGSVTTSAGSVTTGNGAGQTSVSVDTGDIDDGASVTIKYKAKISAGALGAYTHKGALNIDSHVTNLATNEDTINIAVQDVSVSLQAATVTASDADSDGFAGVGEKIKLTAVITNTGSVSITSGVLSLPVSGITDADGSTFTTPVSVSGTGSGTSASSSSAVTINTVSLAAGETLTIEAELTIAGVAPSGSTNTNARLNLLAQASFVANAITTLSDDSVPVDGNDKTLIKLDSFPANDAIGIAASVDADGDGKPDEWNSTCDTACQAAAIAATAVLDVDDDGDGVNDSSDAFPNNIEASIDADNDGLPDAWNIAPAVVCDVTCQNSSGLTLDTKLNDTDNDGAINSEDAFTTKFAASIDADNDGLPDAWTPGCDTLCQAASGLTLDTKLNDSDNDGVTNDLDAFPNDPNKSVKEAVATSGGGGGGGGGQFSLFLGMLMFALMAVRRKYSLL